MQRIRPKSPIRRFRVLNVIYIMLKELRLFTHLIVEAIEQKLNLYVCNWKLHISFILRLKFYSIFKFNAYFVYKNVAHKLTLFLPRFYAYLFQPKGAPWSLCIWMQVIVKMLGILNYQLNIDNFSTVLIDGCFQNWRKKRIINFSEQVTDQSTLRTNIVEKRRSLYIKHCKLCAFVL